MEHESVARQRGITDRGAAMGQLRVTDHAVARVPMQRRSAKAVLQAPVYHPTALHLDRKASCDIGQFTLDAYHDLIEFVFNS